MGLKPEPFLSKIVPKCILIIFIYARTLRVLSIGSNKILSHIKYSKGTRNLFKIKVYNQKFANFLSKVQQ